MRKGVYIHLPFCRSKCWYCDFYSKPYRREDAEAYVEALRRERDIRFYDFPWSTGMETPQWDTAYIGGGTPSIIPFDLLRQVIDMAIVVPGGEYTIEANPEQVDGCWLDEVKSAGINRISMGVQSFIPQHLDAIGRYYQPGKTIDAIEALISSGLNFSLDLIYGLPGQTINQWTQNVRQLLDIRPPHFSAYLLSFEPGTRLYSRLTSGKTEEVPEETAEIMYLTLCREAKDAGYEHYEVSNFALPGYHAKHNSSYWDGTPYLGLGCSAHSFNGVNRASNPASVLQYIRDLSENRLPLEIEVESDLSRLNDLIITSLRTSAGLKIPENAPASLVHAVRHQLSSGNLMEISDGSVVIPEHLWLRSDAIMRDLIQI